MAVWQVRALEIDDIEKTRAEHMREVRLIDSWRSWRPKQYTKTLY